MLRIGALLLTTLLLGASGPLAPLLPNCSGSLPCDSDLFQPVWLTYHSDGWVTKLDTKSIRRLTNGQVVATIYHAPRGLRFDARNLNEVVTDCRGALALQGTQDMAPPRGTVGGALMREMCRGRHPS